MVPDDAVAQAEPRRQSRPDPQRAADGQVRRQRFAQGRLRRGAGAGARPAGDARDHGRCRQHPDDRQPHQEPPAPAGQNGRLGRRRGCPLGGNGGNGRRLRGDAAPCPEPLIGPRTVAAGPYEVREEFGARKLLARQHVGERTAGEHPALVGGAAFELPVGQSGTALQLPEQSDERGGAVGSSRFQVVGGIHGAHAFQSEALSATAEPAIFQTELPASRPPDQPGRPSGVRDREIAGRCFPVRVMVGRRASRPGLSPMGRLTTPHHPHPVRLREVMA